MFFSWGFTQSVDPDSNYYSPNSIRKFADFLYSSGDYRRAVGEYRRFLFASPDSQAVDSIKMKIGKCYRLMADYASANDYFQEIVQTSTDPSIREEGIYQIALCWLSSGDYGKIRSLSTQKEMVNDGVSMRVEEVAALSYLYQKHWDDAHKYINSIDRKDTLFLAMREYAITGQDLPQKSKVVAGTLSALIPGAGKVYCRRPGDGVFSLFLVGLTGFQSYRGFEEKGVDSVSGWVYGVISGVFYLGNVYGSVVAAELYNEQQSDEFLARIRMTFDVNLP